MAEQESGMFTGILIGAALLYGFQTAQVWLAKGDIKKESDRLVAFMADGPIGSGQDYWLIKGSTAGTVDRTALFFGHLDDRQACNDLSDMYNSRYPVSGYRCEPAS